MKFVASGFTFGLELCESTDQDRVLKPARQWTLSTWTLAIGNCGHQSSPEPRPLELCPFNRNIGSGKNWTRSSALWTIRWPLWSWGLQYNVWALSSLVVVIEQCGLVRVTQSLGDLIQRNTRDRLSVLLTPKKTLPPPRRRPASSRITWESTDHRKSLSGPMRTY